MQTWILLLLLIFVCFYEIISTVALEEKKPSIIDHDKCKYNTSCVYGEPNTIECRAGDQTYQTTFPCLYCWQLPEENQFCERNISCKINARYVTSCSVNITTYCLGSRTFKKYIYCNNNQTDYKWSTAVILSVLFGGFGVDRFYLGYWQEGVCKLFTFGGFGVWTLVDTILIFIGYLKPAEV